MARIRTIKPEFPQSESMGRISRDARLCFVMLWTIADDSGRLRGNSRMLASLLFPYDDDAKKLIEKWLAELQHERCIVRYEVNGDSYIEVSNWSSHQKIDKPTASKLPPPPVIPDHSRILANPREDSTTPREMSSEDQGRDQGEEGKGREGTGSSAEPLRDSPPVVGFAPVVLLPLVNGTEHAVSEDDAREWDEAYPAVDVRQQLKAMRQWLLSNPTNRKTATGIRKFVTTWLSKQQNEAPRARGAVGAQTIPGLSPAGSSTVAALQAARERIKEAANEG